MSNQNSDDGLLDDDIEDDVKSSEYTHLVSEPGSEREADFTSALDVNIRCNTLKDCWAHNTGGPITAASAVAYCPSKLCVIVVSYFHYVASLWFSS